MGEFVQLKRRCDQAALAGLEVTSRRNGAAMGKGQEIFGEDTVTMGQLNMAVCYALFPL